MSYLSKQRIDRILGRCFERSWLGVQQGEQQLSRSNRNVTMVNTPRVDTSLQARKKDMVKRVLVDVSKRGGRSR